MSRLSIIKPININKLTYIIFLFSVVTSCEYENIEQQLDFRDDLVGTYTCLETYSYFDPIINDTITNWSTDTISDNTMITVEKFQDSSLNVIIGNYNFIGTYQKIGPFNEKETFTCLECNGPPDYAKFFENDSIYIYRKYGVTNNRDYYGKKQ